MDLVSIKRKYRNRRNLIIAAFLVTIFIILLIIIRETHLDIKYENIYLSYKNLIQQAKEEEKRIAEQKEAERLAKLPKLTDIGKSNFSNIYNSEKKRVFLTFDDGPSKKVTTEILDVLKQEDVKATFFVLGSRVELYPEIVKRQYDEGHYIASHGYSHIYEKIYASPQNVLDEYNQSVTSIRNAIGAQEYDPHLFRFPGGYKGGRYFQVKEQSAQLLEQNGVLNIDWNALTADSAGAESIEDFIAELEKEVPKYNSVIVLMHDAGNKYLTAEGLPTIIQYFRERGFEFENFYSIIK
jgi:peptidoglycan/xylan/chitin deacetylase (PgdA/CDA1 family)